MTTVVVKARPTVTMVRAVPDTVVTVKGLPGAGPPGPPGGSLSCALLTGLKNGINTRFFAPESFIAGSELIYVNGIKQSLTDYTAHPATGEIVFVDAPLRDWWVLEILYQEVI